MKLQAYSVPLAGLAIVLLTLPGCSDLPTTGSPIAGAPNGAAEVMMVSDNGEIQLEKMEFLEAVDRKDQKLVLVDFWAPWCGPCRQLTPSLEALKKKWGEKLEVVEVDIDENTAITRHLRINAIPDVRIFRGGVQIGDFVGLMPMDEIDALLRSLQ